MPNLLKSAFFFTCPACGEGKLYRSGLTVVDQCAVCSLSLKDHDAADGPAFFAMLIIGVVVTPLAVLVEKLFLPPWWVHVLLWSMIVAVSSLFTLKVIKSLMIGLQYKLRRDQ